MFNLLSPNISAMQVLDDGVYIGEGDPNLGGRSGFMQTKSAFKGSPKEQGSVSFLLDTTL
jgi:hypothetical protein